MQYRFKYLKTFQGDCKDCTHLQFYLKNTPLKNPGKNNALFPTLIRHFAS